VEERGREGGLERWRLRSPFGTRLAAQRMSGLSGQAVYIVYLIEKMNGDQNISHISQTTFSHFNLIFFG
jgi:hypothetical protein